MMATLFPLEVLGEQAYLLTAIALGFGFGFALERAGFGSARKLAAQFYLTDMSVFKVMFTAILVAMVGFHAGVSIGWIDVTRMWINPTFLWAQLVGGFLLGVGFILSGLCPGTSVVSLASGRIDAAFALAGVFFGTFLFAVLVDVFPGVQRLYEGSSWGVSLLPTLLHIPAPWMAAAVVVMAGLAFAGAEKVERRFQARSLAAGPEAALGATPGQATPHRVTPRKATPDQRPTLALAPRWGLVGVLAAAALTSGFVRSPVPADRLTTSPRVSSIQPSELAEILVAGRSTQLLLDLDPGAATRTVTIPGAVSGTDPSMVMPLLESLPQAWTVIVFDAEGQLASLPSEWPTHLDYRVVDGGFAAWESDVLTPRELTSATPMERDVVMRQNALAAYFSGAQLEAVPMPPPPVPAGKPKDKKKPGGC